MVDLTLIKKLVAELESSLNVAKLHLKDNNRNDFIIEMAKSAGVTSGIIAEAYMLVGDISKESIGVSGQPTNKDDPFGALLGLSKKINSDPENN